MPLNPGGYFPMRPSPGQAPRSAQALSPFPPLPKGPSIFSPQGLQPRPLPPTMPTGLSSMRPDDYLVPDAYGEYEGPILGRASFPGGAPDLGNESALSGLRAAAEAQPWQQRSRAIGSIGSSGRPQDLALASQLGDRYNRDYADPSIDETEAAMQSLHPAAQAAEEARAMRGAYPAQEAAYGQVESAKASALARRLEAEYGYEAAEAKATADMIVAAMKGLIDVESTPSQYGLRREELDPLAEQQKNLLNMFLGRLGYQGQ